MLSEPPFYWVYYIYFFLKIFFLEKYSIAHYPTLTPPTPLEKKKKKGQVKIEFRVTNKSSHQGKYDIQYIAD